MMLSPSERVTIIAEVARRLAKESWPLIDLTLSQFVQTTTDSWNGDKDDYVIAMLAPADDDGLAALARHIGIDIDKPEPGVIPPFWDGINLRVFISHLAAHRVLATELQNEMREYGMTGFVAHNDIEATAEWQAEIEAALETCEVLIALLHEGFSNSHWTDQEVGFAMGRGLPVFSIRFDATPHGFIGKFQAFNGNGKKAAQIVEELFGVLRQHKSTQRRMGEVIISLFEKSNGFQNAKTNIGLTEEMQVWQPGFSERISKAVESNSQISGAWGVPGRVAKLVDKWVEPAV